jgi:UDP-glucose 4-epimerase
MGKYFRVPCDSRDLNYDKYFVEGQEKVNYIDDYHSHNTERLEVDGMKQLLMKLDWEKLGSVKPLVTGK